MIRDNAGIPQNYHQSMTSRSNWLAYLLSIAINNLDSKGHKEISDALYQADKNWLDFHVRWVQNGR